MKFTIKKNRKGSKFIGVYKDKITKMFYFKNTIDKDDYTSPLFKNEIDAAKKYDEYVKKNDVRCKALNFPLKSRVVKIINIPPKRIYNPISKNSIKRPRILEYVKLIVYSKQKNKCNLCNNNLDTCRIIDHIIPRYLGGYDNINNYQAICGTCNKWKTYTFDYYIKNYIKNTKKISLESILTIQKKEFDKFNGPYIG
jgi:5-methylcytosine-specific restriction endonuclease McrA